MALPVKQSPLVAFPISRTETVDIPYETALSRLLFQKIFNQDLKPILNTIQELLNAFPDWDVNTPLEGIINHEPGATYLLHELVSISGIDEHPLLDLILGRGADATLKDPRGRNAFFYCVSKESVHKLASTIKDPTVLTVTDNEGLTAPLYIANAFREDSDGRMAAISALIDLRVPFQDPLNKEKNWTIIHEMALRRRCTKTLTLFALKGCSLDALDGDKRPPLYYACRDRIYSQILNLLSLGVKPSLEEWQKCIQSLYGFQSFADGNDPEGQVLLADYFFDHGDLTAIGWSKLHLAIYIQDVLRVTKYISEEPQNINKALKCPASEHFSKGYTPLDLALQDEFIFFLLLESNAKPTEDLLKTVKRHPHYIPLVKMVEIYQTKASLKDRYEALLEITQNEISRLEELSQRRITPDYNSKVIARYVQIKQLLKKGLEGDFS